MTYLVLRHLLPCTPDDYWQTVTDRDLCKDLFIDRLRFAKYAVIVQNRTPTGIYREVRAIPDPATVPVFLRHAAEYLEIGDLDWRTSVYAFRCTSIVRTGIMVRGTIAMRAAPGAGPRSTRVSELSVDVPILQGGPFVEARMVENLRQSYETSARFVSDWARARLAGGRA